MSIKFVFLLLPEVHSLDYAGPDQALHEAIDYQADFVVEFAGIKKKVFTSSRLEFSNLKHFTKIKMAKGDFLIIPGSSFSFLISQSFLKEKKLFHWINTLYQQGVNICSICMGAFVLAESGLLEGIPCTTHFKKTSELQKRYPKIKVIENILFTDYNGIYTSAGIASGIDLILHIIEKIKGSHFAHIVARELVVYNRRTGDSAQESDLLKFRNHIHSGIHQVQDFIIENVQKKSGLLQLAHIANMSERNFTRVFKKESGITVNEFITTIRKAKAKEFLKNPDLSKYSIANLVGLKSEKQLFRILNK